MHQRRGYTLVELLVVVFILTILIGLLLPVLRKVRTSAMDMVCASRLRDLTLAGMMYGQDYQRFPAPADITTVDEITGSSESRKFPQRMRARLLNDLRPYLKYPEIPEGAPADLLPPIVQNPQIEHNRQGRGPRKPKDSEDLYYYTGFSYTARLDEDADGTEVVLLQPLRIADARGLRRAVMWADNVYRSAGEDYWEYTHARGSAPGGPLPLTYRDSRGFRGQHRAYTDGSVEWIGQGQLDLTDVGSLETGDTSGPTYMMEQGYWWF